MFISFSKVLASIGGFRLGIRMRVTKNNILWYCLIYLTVLSFQLMWYGCVLAAWIVYAFFYAIYWCAKKLIQAFIKNELTDSDEGTEFAIEQGKE